VRIVTLLERGTPPRLNPIFAELFGRLADRGVEVRLCYPEEELIRLDTLAVDADLYLLKSDTELALSYATALEQRLKDFETFERSHRRRWAIAGCAASGGRRSEGTAGIGMTVFVIGSTNPPLAATGARASLVNYRELTLVDAPMFIVSAGWGRPTRTTGPQYALFTPKVTGST